MRMASLPLFSMSVEAQLNMRSTRSRLRFCVGSRRTPSIGPISFMSIPHISLDSYNMRIYHICKYETYSCLKPVWKVAAA